MAFTSNQFGSSCFSPSSSISHWNHDIFLSFRGIDTRKGFTGHLYTALNHVGIRTFIDDEGLPRGEEIKPELRKAIRESRMSIIVFSENYAASRWCLDELVEILECKRTMGQLVLPVFYDVDPSVVRHQSGSYAKAFQNFVGELEMHNVKKWRAALTEAADLSGHVLRNEENGNESRFIQKIVTKVLPEVNCRCLILPENPVGIISCVNCINMLARIGSNDVRTTGIYGMGGIGKTTISKAVYNENLHHFEGSAFVENIRDASKQHNGLLGLQEKLLFQLLKKDVKLPNVDDGISLLKKICFSKRVLILLDDLDDFMQVKALAGGQKCWFKTGSRIIMVTRDVKLLHQAKVDEIYEVNELDEDDSLELFSWHAFGKAIPSEEYKLLSEDIVRYCKGLPLALEVIGRYLVDETTNYWKSALEELRRIPNEEIQNQLKISFDGLPKARKDIFLDLACFFIGMKKDYPIKFWNACGFFPENGIKDLMHKCLLKIDEGNCLRMHDHLCDMGKEIIRKESVKWPEMRSRLFLEKEVLDVLTNHKGTQEIEGISLNLSRLQPIRLDAKTFDAMCILRLLRVNNVHLSGSFENLFKELRWLSWQYCPLKCLPFDFNPQQLVILEMQYSKINILWQGVKHLENLKILDLSFCELLVETPNFAGLSSLERLMLRGCKNLIEVHSSIGSLLGLCYLDLSYCKNLRTLPSSISDLRSLEELYLIQCSNLKRLPEQIGNIKCLRRFDAGYSAIVQLPDSIELLDKLVYLNLECCSNLRTIPNNIGKLRLLDELDLYHCSNLEKLPDSIGLLDRLVELDLQNCTSLVTLPTGICNHRTLQKLNISGCSNMKRLPEQLGNMEGLTTLLAKGTALERLPDSIGLLKNIRELATDNRIVVPPSVFCLSSLRNLYLYNCRLRDMDIPEFSLSSLEELYLQGNNFGELPLSLGQLSNLGWLHLSNCRFLTIIEELPLNLRVLDASGCTSLRDVRNLSKLTCLMRLNLSNCVKLGGVYGLDKLNKLQDVYMTGCIYQKIEKMFFQWHSEHAYHLFLPRVIPDWVDHCRKESSISFDIPLNLANNFSVMVLWVVYGASDIDSDSGDFYSAVIRNKTGGVVWNHGTNDLRQTSKGHSWVSCIKSNFGNGDSLEISVKELENGAKVEMCGIYLPVKEDVNDKLYILDRLFHCPMVFLRDFEGSIISMLMRYFEHTSDIILPIWEIPPWITDQRMESLISFNMPPLNPANNFQGIILWVVYGKCDIYFGLPNFYSAVIKNKTTGITRTLRVRPNVFKQAKVAFRVEGHSWVSRIKREYLWSTDTIEISINELKNGVKVERCGIHFLYEPDLKRGRDVDLHSSNEESAKKLRT